MSQEGDQLQNIVEQHRRHMRSVLERVRDDRQCVLCENSGLQGLELGGSLHYVPGWVVPAGQGVPRDGGPVQFV